MSWQPSCVPPPPPRLMDATVQEPHNMLRRCNNLVRHRTLCTATRLAMRHQLSDCYSPPLPNHKPTSPTAPHAVHRPLPPLYNPYQMSPIEDDPPPPPHTYTCTSTYRIHTYTYASAYTYICTYFHSYTPTQTKWLMYIFRCTWQWWIVTMKTGSLDAAGAGMLLSQTSEYLT